MPSFDIVSEVDKQELDNAINQARKELATRFDLRAQLLKFSPRKRKLRSPPKMPRGCEDCVKL